MDSDPRNQSKMQYEAPGTVLLAEGESLISTQPRPCSNKSLQLARIPLFVAGRVAAWSCIHGHRKTPMTLWYEFRLP
jgi:hypothetical protein